MLKFIILGIVQGLTEFFPVSSSAHLVIVQKILCVSDCALAVSVVLHLGTVSALMIFFGRDILNLLRDKKLLILIVVATLITGVIGVSGKSFFENLFSQPRLAAIALIFTGIILLLTKNLKQNNRLDLNFKDTLIFGLVQGIAIIPGISRSGITISSLLFRKIDRELCFKFSFLASIPAVLGAAVLELKEINFALKTDAGNLLIGFIFSLISGIFALRLLKIILRKAKFYYFGFYCIIIAVVTLLFLQ